LSQLSITARLTESSCKAAAPNWTSYWEGGLQRGTSALLVGGAGVGKSSIAVTYAVPADFGRLIAAETEKWGKVIPAANIKPE